jgi:hypothetical protein
MKTSTESDKLPFIHSISKQAYEVFSTFPTSAHKNLKNFPLNSFSNSNENHQNFIRKLIKTSLSALFSNQTLFIVAEHVSRDFPQSSKGSPPSNKGAELFIVCRRVTPQEGSFHSFQL